MAKQILWNAEITNRTALGYTFWSFNSHPKGHLVTKVGDATLGVFGYEPLLFKSTNEKLCITTTATGNDSSGTIDINWSKSINKQFPVIKVTISGNKDTIEIKIDSNLNKERYTVKPKSLKSIQNDNKYNLSKCVISTTDFDIIVTQNFKLTVDFNLLNLIRQFADIMIDLNKLNINTKNMNNDSISMKLSKYCSMSNNNVQMNSNGTKSILFDVSKEQSYAVMEINDKEINICRNLVTNKRFVLECDIKPDYKRSMTIAGILSAHGPGTGFSVRVSHKSWGQTKIEWVFTTKFEKNGNEKGGWSHNELGCTVEATANKNKSNSRLKHRIINRKNNWNQKMEDMPEWIHIVCVYDRVSKLQLLQLNNQAPVCRNIKGVYKPCDKHIHIGINPYWKERKFYGQITNIKFDWSIDD